MIDLNPSDPSCIYSTLHFVAEQAEKYRCMPIITFDQPLWWKATMIVDNEPVGSKIKNTVLRLGGFHCQMSFLGCMGKLMGGSGIENILDVANFAQNPIPYILSGKAVSRACMAHFLFDSVLNALLTSISFGLPLINDDGEFEPAAFMQTEN